jgi:predicted acetyltransferase
MQLVKPTPTHIPSYVNALRRGWHDLPKGSSDKHVENKITEISEDATQFLSLFDDPGARALPYLLPDQTVAYAVPSLRRWIWDETTNEYCGTISLRWQNGTTELPPHLMGHVGYTVVPWLRNNGYASFALAEILKLAKQKGLPFLQIVTDVDNLASIRVIEKNGGTLVNTFTKPPMHGAGTAYCYRILC